MIRISSEEDEEQSKEFIEFDTKVEGMNQEIKESLNLQNMGMKLILEEAMEEVEELKKALMEEEVRA